MTPSRAARSRSSSATRRWRHDASLAFGLAPVGEGMFTPRAPCFLSDGEARFPAPPARGSQEVPMSEPIGLTRLWRYAEGRRPVLR